MTAGIRIEHRGNIVGPHTRVYYVPASEDEDEIDISNCVTGVSSTLGVGDVAKATVEVLLIGLDSWQEVEGVVLSKLRRRWRDRLREVTSLASSSRRYVR